jgi:hypothetical protein
MSSRACSRGKNAMLSLLEGQANWKKASFLVGSEGAALARCANAVHSSRCHLHTSATQHWADSLSQPSSVHSTALQHYVTARSAFRGVRSWSSAAVVTNQENDKPKQEHGKPQAELSDRYILSQLLIHIWPPDNFEFRGRVVGALGLLGGSKLLNIQVWTCADSCCTN